MNPFLPRNEYIPDGEARIWADGRLYGRLHTKVQGEHKYLMSRGREDLASFRDLKSSGQERSCRITRRGRGLLLVNLGSPLASSNAEVECDTGGDWTTVEVPLKDQPQGVKSLNLFFVRGELDVESICFPLKG